MDFTKFIIPASWPSDAREFAREAITEISDLKSLAKKMLGDLAGMQVNLERAQKENLELKAKLGTDSSNSHKPPSTDPPGKPTREPKPSGKKPGAQKGHPGSNRKMFPPERVNQIQDVFPERCPTTGKPLRPETMVDFSYKPFQQVDMPSDLELHITEFRLHVGTCPCGCGKTVIAQMPESAGNSVIGVRLKSLMGLMAGRYHLSKALIRELLIDLFGPDAAFSTGCISEAEKELAAALAAPYEEAREAIKKAEAVNVDETSWFLKHDLYWLWTAVSDALTVFYIDPNRSQAAFDRFLGAFEGLIMSDRYSAYSKLSPEERQLCWAHLTRDFRKLVDRQAGAEKLGAWALEEIEKIFGLWRWYLEGQITLEELRKDFLTIRARFGKLIALGKETVDPKARKFCKNLSKLWPALWNFLKYPTLLQPTNNRAEQAIRPAVIGRGLSLGSQSERGIRFTERILTTVATLRKQGRAILSFIQEAFLAFRTGSGPPSLLPNPT